MSISIFKRVKIWIPNIIIQKFAFFDWYLFITLSLIIMHIVVYILSIFFALSITTFNYLFVIIILDFVSVYSLRVNRWIERFHVHYVLVLYIPVVSQPWLQTATIVIHNRASIHSQGTTDPTWNPMRYVHFWTKYTFALPRFEEGEVCLWNVHPLSSPYKRTIRYTSVVKNISQQISDMNIYLWQVWKFQFSSFLY